MKINIKEQDIKMKVTPEQSNQVQKICFGLGIYWNGDTYGYIQYETKPHLFISREIRGEYQNITFGIIDDYFLQSPKREVSAEDFIKTKGFTENITEDKPKESKKDKNKDISKKILKKFIKRIKKEQKNKIYSEVTTYNKCVDILKDIVLEVNKGKKKVKGNKKAKGNKKVKGD